MSKDRLDKVLWQRGLAESRSQAQQLILSGVVRVNKEKVVHPSQTISSDAVIELIHKTHFVSRGGEKLDAALIAFNLSNLENLVCADVGSSTGGFTDCLLQHGAKKVYAIDVGYGLLHWRLRKDSRIVVMEKTNARYVHILPEDIDLITIDASFISLKILLPVVQNWFSEQGKIIALIKPQFEAGKVLAARGRGVIRDREIHAQVLTEIMNFSLDNGFDVEGLICSPLLGPKGNKEFLVFLSIPKKLEIDNDLVIADLMKEIIFSPKIDEKVNENK